MTTIVVKTAVLRRALSNAALFACADDTLPALCAVRFVTDDNTLTLVATDRYALSWETAETVKVAGLDEGFSLGIADAKEVIRLLPRRAFPAAETIVEYDAEAGSVRFAVDGGPEVMFRAVPGEYIRHRALADKFVPGGRDVVAFNPAYLARLAKVDGGDKHMPVRLELSDDGKPVRFAVGDTFRAILMPVRIPAE